MPTTRWVHHLSQERQHHKQHHRDCHSGATLLQPGLGHQWHLLWVTVACGSVIRSAAQIFKLRCMLLRSSMHPASHISCRYHSLICAGLPPCHEKRVFVRTTTPVYIFDFTTCFESALISRASHALGGWPQVDLEPTSEHESTVTSAADRVLRLSSNFSRFLEASG